MCSKEAATLSWARGYVNASLVVEMALRKAPRNTRNEGGKHKKSRKMEGKK
jgi:hypothetical protein